MLFTLVNSAVMLAEPAFGSLAIAAIACTNEWRFLMILADVLVKLSLGVKSDDDSIAIVVCARALGMITIDRLHVGLSGANTVELSKVLRQMVSTCEGPRLRAQVTDMLECRLKMRAVMASHTVLATERLPTNWTLG